MIEQQIRDELAASRRRIWGDTPDQEIDALLTRVHSGAPEAAFFSKEERDSGDIPVRIVPMPAEGHSSAEYARCGWWALEGRLTCNHAASSYGQPVLIIHDRPGMAYGTGDAVYAPGLDGRPCGYRLYHPKRAPCWRSPAFAAALKVALAAGWPLTGEEW